MHRGLAATALAVLALLALTAQGAAQTFTWTGASNPNWKTNGNWLGGVAPTGNGGENLVFPSGAANLLTSNNVNNGTFNSIVIKGSGYTLSNKPVTVGAGGLADSSIGGANTVSLAMTFAATRTVTVSNAATTLTISGNINGAGGLTKSGAGTVALSAANTYTGVTTVNGGTIAIAADASYAPAYAGLADCYTTLWLSLGTMRREQALPQARAALRTCAPRTVARGASCQPRAALPDSGH